MYVYVYVLVCMYMRDISGVFNRDNINIRAEFNRSKLKEFWKHKKQAG